MPAPRLATQVLITALIRRANASGGFAAVLHKGDATSGSILIELREKGRETGLYERVPNMDGGFALEPAGTKYWGNQDDVTQYIARRRKSDADLWVIELDVPDGQRFIAEILS